MRRGRGGMPSFAAVLAFMCGLGQHAAAQGVRADFGLTYLQERTKFVGSGSGTYFMLRGAKVDVGCALFDHLGLVVSGTGLSAVNLRGSLDVEQIAFMAGPRYTWNWGNITPAASSRKGAVFLEGKAGYVIAISGAYPQGSLVQDHASALTYMGGGGLNLHLYERMDLRPIEVEYVRSQLPNGGSNVQNSLRLATGVNIHFGR